MSTVTLTEGEFADYVDYLISFFSARRHQGKTNGDIIFWMGDNALDLPADQLLSSSDSKVPYVRRLYDVLLGQRHVSQAVA